MDGEVVGLQVGLILHLLRGLLPHALLQPPQGLQKVGLEGPHLLLQGPVGETEDHLVPLPGGLEAPKGLLLPLGELHHLQTAVGKKAENRPAGLAVQEVPRLVALQVQGLAANRADHKHLPRKILPLGA